MKLGKPFWILAALTFIVSSCDSESNRDGQDLVSKSASPGSYEYIISVNEKGVVEKIGLDSNDGEPRNRYVFSESATKVASSCPDPTGDDVLFIVEIPRGPPKRVSVSYSTKSGIPIVVAWPENHRKTVKTVSGIGFCEIGLGEVLNSMDAARSSPRMAPPKPATDTSPSQTTPPRKR